MSSELCKQSYPPSHPLIKFDGRCPKEDALRCVESALSSFNDQSPSKQGTKYELVGALDCIMDSKRGVYHCNFIARENEKQAQDMLFFAELVVYNKGLVLSCPLCCILGPKGTETGEYGCKSCQRYPGLIQHPKDRFPKSMVLSPKASHDSGLCNLGLMLGKVDSSQSLEEIKFPWLESASTSSKDPHHDDRNYFNSKLPYFAFLPTSFKNCHGGMFHENAKSAYSSFNKQNIPKKTPSFGGGKLCPCELCRHPASFGGRCPGWIAEVSLSIFNEQSLSKQGPEYELVGVQNFIVHRKRSIYHCNFIARLKNVSKAEDKLFFVELESGGSGIMRCNLCCILGPRGTVTGEYGCMSCLRRPGLVHHPEDGFSKVFEDVRADAGRSILSGDADHRSALGSSEKISGMSTGLVISRYGLVDPPGAFSGLCPMWIAEAALLSFNEQSLSKQGPEYELVNRRRYVVHRKQRIYHCNFIARLKNRSKAEDKLFFAELFDGSRSLQCKLCCILGPRGTVTGEYGCMSCLRRPGQVHHPKDGFLKVFQDVNADAGHSTLSREADHRPGLEGSEKVSGTKLEDKASGAV